MLGASGQPVLQVVPTLTSYNVTGGTLQLFGSGFEEGNNSSYNFAGAAITDVSTDTTVVNVFAQNSDNSGVNITEPVHGLGGVTVTTAGGTSAALSVNDL